MYGVQVLHYLTSAREHEYITKTSIHAQYFPDQTSLYVITKKDLIEKTLY